MCICLIDQMSSRFLLLASLLCWLHSNRFSSPVGFPVKRRTFITIMPICRVTTDKIFCTISDFLLYFFFLLPTIFLNASNPLAPMGLNSGPCDGLKVLRGAML